MQRTAIRRIVGGGAGAPALHWIYPIHPRWNGRKRQLDYLGTREKYGVVDGFKFDGGDAFFDEDDASFT